MPRTQYPISGVVYDTDGTTKMTSGIVVLINTTLDERISDESIESDGSFSVDAANTTTEYSNGDKLQVLIYNSNNTKSTEFRHTLDTGETGYNKGDVYMHWTQSVLRTARLKSLVVSNKHDSNEYTVDLYNREDDEVLLTIDVGTNDTKSIFLGLEGLKFDGGICVIRQSDAANTVEVQMVVK